jgi:hypothetical protein
MKKKLLSPMIMGLAAMMASAQSTTNDSVVNNQEPFGLSTFVGGGNFGFRIPMNIPNQRQRRILARRRNHRK